MYILPVFATFDPNRSPETPTQEEFTYSRGEYEPVELKAQISFKTKVAQDLLDTNADLWFGYTQQMHWQVYNEDESRPFRANDYMPELFVTLPVTANSPKMANLECWEQERYTIPTGKGSWVTLMESAVFDGWSRVGQAHGHVIARHISKTKPMPTPVITPT